MQEESATEVKHGGVASAQEEADTEHEGEKDKEPEKLISGPQRTPEGLETLHVRSGHTRAWLLTILLR